jgi:N-carbamoylputrescine amidase
MQNLIVAAASVKNLVGQPDDAIARMQTWIQAASEQGAELILFPELNVSGYIPAPVAPELAEPVPGPSTEKIAALAGKYHLCIAFGILEKEAGGVYCTHVLVSGAGLVGKQRKIHVPAQEKPYWQAGNAIEVFDIGKAKVGIAICRDAFFGEMTRTLYFKGAEVVLMPFGYYNCPRKEYLQKSIHGMSIIKACWTNGFYTVVANSAEGRPPNPWEPEGRVFPGWAGVFSPWGRVIRFVDDEGNDERLVVEALSPAELEDRRGHPNFLAKELRPELYCFL